LFDHDSIVLVLVLLVIGDDYDGRDAHHEALRGRKHGREAARADGSWGMEEQGNRPQRKTQSLSMEKKKKKKKKKEKEKKEDVLIFT
jgi:hypothetical protein